LPSQDFLPKLKEHLLSRVISTIRTENGISEEAVHDRSEPMIFFKSDRMYRHNIMRLNYTTYDTRRCQDVINPSTSHHNIMVLNGEDDDHQNSSSRHPFCYAQVLGIYHVNVIYTGPGMVDYRANRMEFLWVRWYRKVDSIKRGWGTHQLDLVQFLPMASGDAFGFIDLLDVMRGSHIIPAFANGKCHVDDKGLSLCAQDSSDWASYYVNRYVSELAMP